MVGKKLMTKRPILLGYIAAVATLTLVLQVVEVIIR